MQERVFFDTSFVIALENLYIYGNDQGMVGIVGTILSGISIANRYLLKT